MTTILYRKLSNAYTSNNNWENQNVQWQVDNQPWETIQNSQYVVGDYVFGQGNQDFYTDLQATAQAIYTRLQLLQGTFWRALNDGLPAFQQILGIPGNIANISQVDTLIQNRIIETPHVTNIVSYASNLLNRQYQAQASVLTEFSSEPVSITITI